MTTVSSSVGPSVVLTNVTWGTYERLVDDLADSSAPRLTYDREVLEIMSPTPEHERLNRMLTDLIGAIAEELDIDTENLGSSTFKREDLERGFEPDSCLYIQNAARVRGKSRLDLSVDPPPDLVIEIDITSASIEKLPLYALVGVPEVWRYDGSTLRLMKLEGKEYVLTDFSPAFPLLTAKVLEGFLDKSMSMRRPELLKAFRAWIRKSVSSSTKPAE